MSTSEVSPGIGELADRRLLADGAAADWHVDDIAAPLPWSVREHRVAAVVVACNGARWLPRVLAGIAEQTRPVDVVIGVDVASSDATGQLLADAVAAGSLGRHASLVEVAAGTSFGDAVGSALAQAPTSDVIDLRDEPVESVDWVWLLHDDSAPAPDALQRLLDQADRVTSAAVVGPKVHAWARPDVLVECGLALSRAGRPETGVTPGDVDQGQLDGRLDVMAVSTPGMLVRRDLWEQLGGFAAAFPDAGADTDFCWRARRSGARVIVAPQAVVYHRRAATAGLRPVHRSGSVRRRARTAAVVTALAQVPLWRLPITAIATLVGGLLRCVLGIVTLAPRQAGADLAATAIALTSWRRITSARRSIAATATIPARELRHLRPRFGQRIMHWQESTARSRAIVSDEDRWARRVTRFGRLLGGAVAVLAVVCLLAGWGLWFTAGDLAGGALLPAPDSGATLLGVFGSPWHDVALGSALPAPPYLIVLAALTPVTLGSATALVTVLLLGAPVFAGASMMLALRGLVRRPVLLAAGLAYGLLPATVSAVDSGRLGTAIAAAVLPLSLRFLVRLTGLADGLAMPTRRTVVAATLLVAVLGSVTPALAITVVVGAAAAAAFARRAAAVGQLGLVALLVTALLWPWSGTLLANPGLLLLEIGAHPASIAENPDVWQLGLLSPGGAAPFFLAAALVAVAVAAVLPARTRRVAVTAWFVVFVGLLLAIAQVAVSVNAAWSPTPVQSWAGPGLLLAGAGMVAAAAFAASGLAAGRRPARIAVAALLIAPAMVAGWWIPAADGPVQRDRPGVISPFVAISSLGPQAPRSLDLAQRPDGTVTYRILAGSGPRLGDAEVAPDVATVASLSAAVSRMAAGSGAALDEVAAASVRFLSVQVKQNRELARQLDAVPGLRRVSTIDGQGLWEVAEPVARVRASGPDGVVALASDATGPSLTAAGPLPAGATSVQLAELADPVWRAHVGDQQLEPTAESWQTFAVPAGVGGDVTVAVDGTGRLLQLLVPAAVLTGLLLAALWAPGSASRSRDEELS